MSDRTNPCQQPQESVEKKISMHDGVADWCDVCVCEAEPYWKAVADEMGINMSDYEDGR